MSVAHEPRVAGETNILIVDDLPEKHLVYHTVLDGLGPKIISAHSGADALKQVLQYDFAVILLDVNMPDMDGFETARLIRQRKRSASTPIIFLTAFADEVRTAQGYATGAVDYLPTPVVPGILRAKVRVFVELFELRRQMAHQAEERAKHLATEEANRRMSFLADAGAVLGRSLAIEATARDIVRLPVPLLAEISVLKLNPIVEERQRILIARAATEGRVNIEECDSFDSLSTIVADAFQRSLASNKSEFLFADEGQSSMNGIVIPLQARGRTFAVLGLLLDSNVRTFRGNDVTIAEAFSSRATMALDNALLHEGIRFADRQKNDFLSMLAHELRNPLAPIRNAAQLLERHVPDEPGVRWACEVIDRQVIQMVRLVDDLLDVARITRDKIHLQREKIEVSTVIARAVEASRPAIDASRHQLLVEHPQKPLRIAGDMIRLTQVLTNLLNNAAKYTEAGGKIWLKYGQEGDAAVIRVRDTGIGIPRQMLESVFELFTQVDRALDRSHGGLGIGLTLVKRLVEMHDGKVEAKSEGLGKGSEFLVHLPVVAASPGELPATPRETDTTVVMARRRILVVDDNQDSARTLSMMLKLMGHDTATAFDGLEALDVANSYRPDAILLDIGLPKLNGYDVCRRLRQLPAGRQILVIALTGWGQDEDRSRSSEAGFDHHLVKPVDVAVLEMLLANRHLPRS
ncbi:ATP-binding response regulator [Schlesneria paludicola]|uniref:ATP-binding response regulator n=1 Tax=Schlesneria paludicola TaxID=360056 RepID=UPI000299D13C|nr:response regulator [Schlesneria paludicola]